MGLTCLIKLLRFLIFIYVNTKLCWCWQTRAMSSSAAVTGLLPLSVGNILSAYSSSAAGARLLPCVYEMSSRRTFRPVLSMTALIDVTQHFFLLARLRSAGVCVCNVPDVSYNHYAIKQFSVQNAVSVEFSVSEGSLVLLAPSKVAPCSCMNFTAFCIYTYTI